LLLFASLLAAVLTSLCAAVMTSACSRDGQERAAVEAHANKPEGREPVFPQRIVSLSPSTTEAVFALGAGSRLVGRSKFCDYPAEAAKVPSVGGYVDPSLEVILSLQPDLVVGARGPAGSGLADRLGEQGIPTFFPTTASLDEIRTMLRKLGAKLGRPDDATALIDGINAQVKRVSHQLQTDGKPLPRALLVFGTKPIVVAGPESFPGEVLTLAGARNVMAPGRAYPKIGMETLIALDPDVILDATVAAAHDGSGIALDAPGWRTLRAVRGGQLIPIRDEAVLRPGPRVGDGLITLANALHPSVPFDGAAKQPTTQVTTQATTQTSEPKPIP
jgi:iron complex transport system substrate-binding protein